MPLATEDIVAIQQLAARYNHAIDTGDGETYASLFTSGGSLDNGEIVIVGQEALRKFAVEVGTSGQAMRHSLTDLMVEGDGITAQLRAYLRVTVAGSTTGQREELVSGSYADRLVRVDGQWRFAERVFRAG